MVQVSRQIISSAMAKLAVRYKQIKEVTDIKRCQKKGSGNMKYDYIECGDCLELMKEIPDKSIDMILCDLPYGTTKNKWDTTINLELLWNEYKRIIKRRGCIALFAQTPFDKVLGASNLQMLKYEWIWEKASATGFLNSKKMPLKKHENILIFYNKLPTYNPQGLIYNPKIQKRGGSSFGTNYGKAETSNYAEFENYPTDILRYKYDKDKLHPTQKPVALCEYLIRTYTNEGDLVLDNCMGSGSTGVACVNTNRHYIGFELDKDYYNIACKRLAEVKGMINETA